MLFFVSRRSRGEGPESWVVVRKHAQYDFPDQTRAKKAGPDGAGISIKDDEPMATGRWLDIC
jgi:hypothetical protein